VIWNDIFEKYPFLQEMITNYTQRHN
jgi:hypothetical protein